VPIRLSDGKRRSRISNGLDRTEPDPDQTRSAARQQQRFGMWGRRSEIANALPGHFRRALWRWRVCDLVVFDSVGCCRRHDYEHCSFLSGMISPVRSRTGLSRKSANGFYVVAVAREHQPDALILLVRGSRRRRARFGVPGNSPVLKRAPEFSVDDAERCISCDGGIRYLTGRRFNLRRGFVSAGRLQSEPTRGYRVWAGLIRDRLNVGARLLRGRRRIKSDGMMTATLPPQRVLTSFGCRGDDVNRVVLLSRFFGSAAVRSMPDLVGRDRFDDEQHAAVQSRVPRAILPVCGLLAVGCVEENPCDFSPTSSTQLASW